MVDIDKNTVIWSPSKGAILFSDALAQIKDYISQVPDAKYEITVGSDSMTYDDTIFCLCIVVHRAHNGGIYFYKRYAHARVRNLHHKLELETQLSVDTAKSLLDGLKEEGVDVENDSNIDFCLHLDIGKSGPTKEFINELEGYVEALGYDCKIKPDSYAASTLADRYSK